MPLTDFIRSIFGRSRAGSGRVKSREEMQGFWMNPTDDENATETYLVGEERSRFLLDIVKRYVGPEAAILEIGCNVGRNLQHLFQGGFKNLNGIEINPSAVALMKKTFPEMANEANIHNAPVEDVIKQFDDEQFDLIYTMAVLEHIHSDSEWIFAEMVRATGNLVITIEDERGTSSLHIPRDYQRHFEPLGMEQVEMIDCADIEGLGPDFAARVFRKT